ncbi:MAG: hypothetical protein IJ055_09950 [Oscillospiraceae bacterium]|nr:hypothetical protein [Oscillospiraceae bacterium]
MYRIGAPLLAAGLFVLAAGCHARTVQGIAAAGLRCVQVLVPSLYFYSVLAGFAVSSGMLRLTRCLRPLCRVLHLDAELLAVLLFSQIAGYPVGAQLLHGMYREGRITRAQEGRLACVCMGAGPGFVLGTVGGVLPPRTARWLLLSVSLPGVLLGLVILRGERTAGAPAGTPPGLAVLLTDAVERAAQAMLRICAMVLLFGALTALLDPVMPGTLPWRSVLEVSFLTREALPLPAAAALLAFGGLCVHCQVAAVCEGALPWGRLLLCRGICAAGAGVLCYALLHVFPQALPAAVIPGTAVQPSAHPLPGLCLMLMSVLLVLRPGGIRQKR